VAEIYWHEYAVSREEREEMNGNKGCVVWFTGLSASGKSTIANILDRKLHMAGHYSVVLDGDNVRHSLNSDLGFSAKDREENIRRIGCVAKLFCEAGLVAITAFISPYRVDRKRARDMVKEEDFIEVFVDTPLEVCESRDPKGLYKKARAGKIKGFTGIDDPYEPPEAPELVHDGNKSPEELSTEVIEYLEDNRII
jgi:adenylylsulfate kinase